MSNATPASSVNKPPLRSLRLYTQAELDAALAEAETRGYVAGVERENRSFGFAYQQGRAGALREVIGDLDARIDREVAEKDGDGLLDGLRYARDCITAMKGASND
jgi:hypothetical protein